MPIFQRRFRDIGNKSLAIKLHQDTNLVFLQRKEQVKKFSIFYLLRLFRETIYQIALFLENDCDSSQNLYCETCVKELDFM